MIAIPTRSALFCYLKYPWQKPHYAQERFRNSIATCNPSSIAPNEFLRCVPRDSLAWLLLFGVETMHGRINTHAFELLEASYETSPNEAWVALRRATIATPVLLSAPERTRRKILDEFGNLIDRGFEEIPARAYLAAPASARKLLQSRIEELDSRRQESFANMVQKLRS